MPLYKKPKQGCHLAPFGSAVSWNARKGNHSRSAVIRSATSSSHLFISLWSSLRLRSCCRQIVCVVYRGFQQVFGLAISRQGSRNKLSFRPIQF